MRLVVEADRRRFVELFRDPEFMIFAGKLSIERADERFDHMLALCQRVSYAKQAIVERSTGEIVGYTGVDEIDLDGRHWLEWGYRLIPAVRGRGYATEASLALLDATTADRVDDLLAIIHPGNHPSQQVIRKMGFEYWRAAMVDGEQRRLYLRRGSVAQGVRS